MATLKTTLADDIQHPVVQLRIVAKAGMNGGQCYIGWNGNRLVRPIPRTEEDQCCWINTHFAVGDLHKFQVLDSDPEVPYPHRADDVLVKHEAYVPKTEPGRNLFDLLYALRCDRVEDVFYGWIRNDMRYVEVGTVYCPSVGIYKCMKKNISFLEESGKIRCLIKEFENAQGNIRAEYKFPITTRVEYATIDRMNAEDEILIILGLGRPMGNVRFDRKCYVLVIGVVIKESQPPDLVSNLTSMMGDINPTAHV